MIRDLRGNVNTRLAKLDAGEYDAIILAAAGLKRLEMAQRITAFIEPEQSLPANGQGLSASNAASTMLSYTLCWRRWSTPRPAPG